MHILDSVRQYSIYYDPENSLGDIVLNKFQRKLLKTVVDSSPITPPQLATILNTNTANACAHLRKLWKKGYLSRINIGNHAGGNEYEYRLRPELKMCGKSINM